MGAQSVLPNPQPLAITFYGSSEGALSAGAVSIDHCLLRLRRVNASDPRRAHH
jgi:hypothetical protein